MKERNIKKRYSLVTHVDNNIQNLGRLWLAYSELQVDFTDYNRSVLTMDCCTELKNHSHRSIM